jgi:hypothetical protein
VLARRFLWIVAGLVVLVVAGAIGYRIFERQLLEVAMVPTVEFKEVPAATPQGPDYADASMWHARPDIPDNPALWLPEGYADPVEEEEQGEPGPDAKGAEQEAPKASVFFIHPTSFLDRSRWNSPLDDQDSQKRAQLFVRSQASAFNGVGEIWAPKYRQATFGAFLTSKEDANKALNFAYRDVLAAFDAFVSQAPKDRPLILAAHSQGSLHLTRLLAERVAGKPIAERIAAVYAIGWPVSKTADVALLGLPACEKAEDSGCLISWQSFAEPADPKMITDVYDSSFAANGAARAGSPMLCINPLTGNAGDQAEAEANRGTLIPNGNFSGAHLKLALVPARCDVRGFLLIGAPPEDIDEYVLPGNNYHVFDYALFWGNLRADAKRRLESFLDE